MDLGVKKLREMPQARMGMWLLIAGEFVIFGGLMVTFLLYRFRHEEWAEAASHTNVVLGAINTFVLLSTRQSPADRKSPIRSNLLSCNYPFVRLKTSSRELLLLRAGR